MEKNKLERMNLSKYLKTKYKDVKDVDPADVDDVATAKDIASADKNIMIQLKKQIGLGNSFKVEFGDKKTARVPDKIAKAAIALYDKHKTSQQKGDYQKTISKSYKDLLSFIRKGKPVAMESVIIQEPLDPEKHDVKKYIDDFQKSTNSQFDGLSKEKRKEMAIAAYLKAKDKKEDMKNSKDKKEETLIRSVQQIMLNKDTKQEVREAYLDYVLPKLSFNSTSEFKKAIKYLESQGLSQGYRGNEMEPAFDFNKFKDEITIYNLDELSPRINSKRGVDSFLKKGRFKYELNYVRNEGFASDAQRRAAFASGYKEKGKKKKEEVELDEQPKHEITVGNYTTKFFHMCGSAQEVMNKYADKDGAEELAKMQDVFFKMEKDAMNSGSASEEQKKKAQILYDKIITKAKDVGIEDEVQKYMIKHLTSMTKGDPKLGFGRTDINEEVELDEKLDKDDETIVKKVIGKLKKASQAHAGQSKDLQKALDEDELGENFRTLATKGMGTETKQRAKVGQELDFYEPKRGDKFLGKIIKMDNKGYQVQGLDRQFKGKIFTFKYYDKNKAKNLLQKEEHLDERSKISDVVAKPDAERLAIVKKHYPFIADITDKRKKDKTVQGFFHFLKNKDKKAVDKLDNIIKKLGTKKGIAYIDSYRQNYLRMSNSEEEK